MEETRDDGRTPDGKFGKGNVLGLRFSQDYQPSEKWTEAKAIELGDELVNWLREGEEDHILFQDFLVIEKGLYHELIAYLARKFQSFYDRIQEAKDIQEAKLLKYGLKDKIDGNFAKLILSNRHDFLTSKNRQEITGKDGDDLFEGKTDDELVAELEKLRSKTKRK